MSFPELPPPRSPPPHPAAGDVPYHLPPAYFVIELDLQFGATTDAGHPIPLYHFQPYVFPLLDQQLTFRPEEDGQLFLRMAEQNFLANTKQAAAALDCLSGPSAAANCHGWVFARGRFLIEDSDVLTVLRDNGYVRVTEPRDGDLAVYVSGQRCAHSGFVRMKRSGSGVLVESKWGPFGVYTHEPQSHPFPGECRYFRSNRVGHAMTIIAANE